MKVLPRREFLRVGAAAGLALSWPAPGLTAAGADAGAAPAAPRRFTSCLSPGSIGVNANQTQTIELAHRHGFEAVEPFAGYLAGLSSEALVALRVDLQAKRLAWGAAGLPVDFRSDEARFQEGLKGLVSAAAGLQRAGVTRVGTWISPAHARLTYVQNFRLHAVRLREVARVLGDHALRLGLEYVGTPTSWRPRKFAFVHSLIELRDLLGEIGAPNVGVVLDSWHWWTAGDTEAELRGLRPTEVVSVDLNDAPAGLTIEQQLDNRRELPLATGVIPLKAFVGALQAIGYDGPCRAEPFNQALNALDDEAACAATGAAMARAMALVEAG